MKFTTQMISALATLTLLGNPAAAEEEIGKCLADDYDQPSEGCGADLAIGLDANSLSPPEGDDQEEPELKKLRWWHLTNEGAVQGLYLTQIEPYKFEFVANTDIRADTMVTFIPDSLLMTAQNALSDSPTCKAMQEKGLLSQLKSQVIVPLAIHFIE